MIFTKEWPKESGFYWFYGKRFDGDETKLYVVQVVSNEKYTIYDTIGISLYKQEGADGYWQRIPEPELP